MKRLISHLAFGALFASTLLVVSGCSEETPAAPEASPAEERNISLEGKNRVRLTVSLDEDWSREAITQACLAKNPQLAADNAALQATVAEQLDTVLPKIAEETFATLHKRLWAVSPCTLEVDPTTPYTAIIEVPQEALLDDCRRMILVPQMLNFRIVHKANDELCGKVMDAFLTPDGFERSTCNNQPCFVRREDGTAASYSALAQADRTFYKKALEKLARDVKVDTMVYECLLECVGKDVAGKDAYCPVFVARSAKNTMSGATVSKATAVKVASGIVINLEFNAEGTEQFGELTRRNVGRQLAVVLDDVVLPTPVIREAITGGQCEISGGFTMAEAKWLAKCLSAGVFSAPLVIVDETLIRAEVQ